MNVKPVTNRFPSDPIRWDVRPLVNRDIPLPQWMADLFMKLTATDDIYFAVLTLREEIGAYKSTLERVFSRISRDVAKDIRIETGFAYALISYALEWVYPRLDKGNAPYIRRVGGRNAIRKKAFAHESVLGGFIIEISAYPSQIIYRDKRYFMQSLALHITDIEKPNWFDWRTWLNQPTIKTASVSYTTLKLERFALRIGMDYLYKDSPMVIADEFLRKLHTEILAGKGYTILTKGGQE